MDSKLLATRTRTILKELGHDVSLGHIYELYSQLAGYKSWNVASKQKDPFAQLIPEEKLSPVEQAIATMERYVKEGLPEAYVGDIEAMLYHWYSDMPWGGKEQARVLHELLISSKFIIASHILGAKYQYNIYGNVQEASYSKESTVDLATSFVDDLERYLAKPEGSFPDSMEVWYFSINKGHWTADDADERTIEICRYIRLDPRYKSIASRAKKLHNYTIDI